MEIYYPSKDFFILTISKNYKIGHFYLQRDIEFYFVSQ